MKATLKDFLNAKEEVIRLKDICFSDDSNDEFDELHDGIYWQIAGINDTIYEIVHGVEPCERELASVKQMIAQIKSEYKRRVSVIEIDWVYG